VSIEWPEGIVDPHIHQWDPITTERVTSKEARLLRPLPRVPRWVRAILPQADREFAGNPNALVKPYLPATYAADAGPVPVATVVHVEAEWPAPRHIDSVEETHWITSLPFGEDGAPELGALVVAADPRKPDVGEVLDAHLAASDLVRGVRFKIPTHPDPAVRPFCDDPEVLDDPAFRDGFGAIGERGLSFDLWAYCHQLPKATRLVADHPETTFVLDHFATPVGIFGPRGKHTGQTAADRATILATWREDLAAIAAYPNVVAKASGLGMPITGNDPRRPYDGVRLAELSDRTAPLIQHLHACFGPDRVMWASNFPMDKPTVRLSGSIQILLDALGADAQPAKLLRDVARATYRLV
jgi:L-fuconolactonase